MKASTNVKTLSVQLALYIEFINDDIQYPDGVFMVIEPYSGEDFFYIRNTNNEFQIEGEGYLMTDAKDLQEHINSAINRGKNFYYRPWPE